MPRRASSGIRPAPLLGGLLALVLIAGGGYWFLTRTPDGFQAEELNIEQYLTNQQALVGNEVQATGVLEDRHNQGDQQMVILRIEDSGTPRFLPILVPSDLKTVNLNIEQKYAFLLRFNAKGLAVATDIKAL